mgnify:CR=1 FL=1
MDFLLLIIGIGALLSSCVQFSYILLCSCNFVPCFPRVWYVLYCRKEVKVWKWNWNHLLIHQCSVL